MQGNIRTYNGFVANAPAPYTGGEAAWLSLAGNNLGNTVLAQVGWAKTPQNPPHIYDPVWFYQWTYENGTYADAQYYNVTVLYPPTHYTYQVTTTGGGAGGIYYNFFAGGTYLGSSIELFWNKQGHQAYSEVHNFRGDQLPGDGTAHVTFDSVQWSPDQVSWYGSALSYEKGTPVVPGQPSRNEYPNFFDEISWLDGSNFETWDTRCP